MINRTIIQVVVAVVLVVFVLGTVLDDGAVQPSWLRFYSVAVFLSSGLLTSWDRWIWRWTQLQRLSFVPPDLRGTWEGTLASQWVNPETGAKIATKTAYLVIHQTFSSVRVTLLTDESRSESSLGRVTRDHHVRSLDYMYINNPDLGVEHRSRSHHGSTTLAITGTPATRLRGRYWTDRDSKGELDLTKRFTSFADDYEQARNLLAAAPTVFT